MTNHDDDLIYEAIAVDVTVTEQRVTRWYAAGAVVVTILGMLSVAVLLLTWPPRMEMGFAGAVRLVYQIADEPALGREPQAPADAGVTADLLHALRRRVDPSRTKEIIVQQGAANRVEILLPPADLPEYERIKKSISTTGFLQFRIVANSRDHGYTITRAKEMAEDQDKRHLPAVYDEDGSMIGIWSRVACDLDSGAFRLSGFGNTLRNAATGEVIEIPTEQSGDQHEFSAYMRSRGIKDVDVLLATDDLFDVNGSHLGVVSRGNDEQLRPCLFFNMNKEGTMRFAGLTVEYGPEGQFTRQLAIVLDNQVLTAPNIQEPITGGRGRITGDFTAEEVTFMASILEAGSLPVALDDEPVEETELPPDPIATRTIQRTVLFGAIGLAAVWLLLLVRYRWFGLAATLASGVQLALAVAMLVMPITFDRTVISTILLSAFVATVLNGTICEFIRSRKALVIQGCIGLLFVLLCWISAWMRAVGSYDLQNIAACILCSSISGLVVLSCQWLLPTLVQTVIQARISRKAGLLDG